MIKNLFRRLTKNTPNPKQEVLLLYNEALYLNHLLCFHYARYSRLGTGFTNWLSYCFPRLGNFENVAEMREKLYQFTLHPKMDRLFYDVFLMELEDTDNIMLLTKFCRVFGVETERGKK